jgi:hypothetical protein
MVHYLCLSFFLVLSSNNPTQNEKKQMFLCFVGRATNLFLSFSSLKNVIEIRALKQTSAIYFSRLAFLILA